MKKFGADRERIFELLEHEGGVTSESVRKVHQATGVPEADIWGAGMFYSLINTHGKCVRICDGLTCQMMGADKLASDVAGAGKTVERVSCLGQCDRAPATLDEAMELVVYSDVQTSVLPDNAALPMNLGGADDTSYSMLEKVRSMDAEKVIEEVKEAGLQGRGGAGFPAHFKWTSVLNQVDQTRYVVCNADEAEPGTFKDREVILRRPHLILEGLAIAAEVVRARDIFIYIRGEYVNEVRVLERAIEEAATALGDLTVHIVRGHGAYICGEETALLESMEGKRGMPRLKPPFPTEQGFRNRPTLMHNVETIACVPSIVRHGGKWFHEQGRTEAGSKLYCISGHIGKPGVYELPLGVTLDELVEVAGGYVGNPIGFSPGGASSGFLPMSFRDTPMDYQHLSKAGSMLGSSGVVVINDTIDMVDAARWQLAFFERESCGQCAPCRIGTQYLRRQLDKFVENGDNQSLAMAEEVSWEMEEGSICGLGMVAFKPLESARKHFPEAFRGQ